MFTPFNCSAEPALNPSPSSSPRALGRKACPEHRRRRLALERFELLEQIDPIGDLNALRHHSPMY